MQLPKVIAHRGASGYAPENTISAITKAHAQGARWIEIDVMLSGDGVPVVIHDEILGRTANDHRAVADLTLQQLRHLDAGSWFAPEFVNERIPMLREVIDHCVAFGVGLNLEIKPSSGRERETAQQICRFLENYPFSRLPAMLVSSFAWETLEIVHEHLPELPKGCLVGNLSDEALAFASRYDCFSINLGNDRVAQADIARVAQQGFRSLVYTVNDPERAKQLFTWGVDAVFTDVPDKILEIATS